MLNLRTKLKQTQNREITLKEAFRSENGAIDLASIMVGIIVIGMIGGVIAATVFAIIPWSQDNAAKQQLDSVVAAESAYMGLSSTSPPSLPTGLAGNSYGNSSELETAGLLKAGPRYCVSTTNTGPSSYEAFAQSSSGNIWSATDKVTKPVIFTGTLPADCQFITEGVSAVTPDPTVTATPTLPSPAYADSTPTRTILTYKCDTTITGEIPMRANLSGTETWSDGVTKNYANATAPTTRSLSANTTYTMTFDGTYDRFFAGSTEGLALSRCLLAVDHWGRDTGVKDASYAFYNAAKLTDVPANIPPTITTLNRSFWNTTTFNDVDVSNWTISNVTNLKDMFSGAAQFNQPLASWNTANVTDMSGTFNRATRFNQPLNSWNVSSVIDMNNMFSRASAFNQSLTSWDVSNAADLSSMFALAGNFNGDISNWNTTNVTNMSLMFDRAYDFNGNISNWNTTNVTNMKSMFYGATIFNSPLNNWDVSKVITMENMFFGASSFNQPLISWKTANVTNMGWMFNGASKFNQPLSSWNTANVTNMYAMFYGATVFNQNIKSWNVTKVGANSTNFRTNSALTAANSPF